MAATRAKDAIYAVVLAGGSGERLWPISRAKKPKQLLQLGSEKTLLEQAIIRLRAVGAVCAVAMTSVDTFLPIVSSYDIDTIFVEPVARNTGPAVLYSCLKLYDRHPMATVIFTPADAYIPQVDTVHFARYAGQLIQYAREQMCIVMMGVRPTYSVTGYGYIAYNADQQEKGPFLVKRFHEKPSKGQAVVYSKQQHMLWNIGVFAAPISLIIAEFEAHAPDMVQAMRAYFKGKGRYEDIPAISVDHAIMEKSRGAKVLPVDFSWSDVGNLARFLSIKCARTSTMDTMIEFDARDNLVDVPRKLVAVVGVDNLCVVETEDVLVISKRSEVEQVRHIVARLKKNKQMEYV